MKDFSEVCTNLLELEFVVASHFYFIILPYQRAGFSTLKGRFMKNTAAAGNIYVNIFVLYEFTTLQCNNKKR